MWKGYSGDCLDFLKKLLTKNPKSRLSAKKALTHPWVSRVSTKKNIEDNEKDQIIERMKNFRVNMDKYSSKISYRLLYTLTSFHSS